MFNEILEKIKENFQNEPDKKSTFIKFASAVLILLIIFGVRMASTKQDDLIVDTSANAEEVVETSMFVDISGEVNNPGVYQFTSGTRLYEVIDKAGGLTNHADKNGINQAEFVEDGQKIVIPSIAGSSVEESGPYNESATNSNGLININNASKSELMEITGVGEVIAERIIEYRNSNRFKNIEELQNVKGIGPATYEKMKTEITV